MARVEFDLSEISDNPAQALRMIGAHINDLVVKACALANRQWTDASMPEVVSASIRSAMVRYIRRPEGFVTSSSGDERLSWSIDAGHGGTPTFTRDEVDQIRAAVAPGRPALGTIPTTRYGGTRSPAASHWVPIR